MNISRILNSIKKILTNVDANVYAKTTLKLFLVLYAGLAAPKLPPFIAKFFDYTIFKIIILAIILIVSNNDPGLSLMIALAFFISLTACNKYKICEDIFGIPMTLIGKTKDFVTGTASTISETVADVISDDEVDTTSTSTEPTNDISGYEPEDGAVIE